MNYFTPKEVCTNNMASFHARTLLPISKMIVLGLLAGAYISFGAQAATMVTHDIATAGVARLVGGAIFSTGLMLVIVAGAELFTGNVLLFLGVLHGAVKPAAMLRNWLVVYAANFAGAVLVAYLMYYSNLWSYNSSLVGVAAIKTASAKVTMSFTAAMVRGILCNWLVCLAVWMALAGKDIISKIFGVFFPITLFVASNFEHSVANMYYVPAGILAMRNPATVNAGHLADKLGALTWQGFLTSNLLPVTLGNVLGAALFVVCFYWFVYLRGDEASASSPIPGQENKRNGAEPENDPDLKARSATAGR